MASATGIPDTPRRDNSGLGEDEPLLGRAGDAAQEDGKALPFNLFIGTAVIAQGGLILLTALVWASVFLAPLSLFSAHPLLNSSGILLASEAVIILQPTHTATQKRQGTIAHLILNVLGLNSLIAGLVIIEYNKFSHGAAHFTSVHGKLGLITYILLAIQSFVGFTQYFVPKLYGGVNNAKALYKYHRASGYVILVVMLATASAASVTDTGRDMLHLKLWSFLVCAALILVGILPRIKKQKLGLGPAPSGAFGQ